MIVTRYSYTFSSVRHISSWFRSVSAIMEQTWYEPSTHALMLCTLVDSTYIPSSHQDEFNVLYQLRCSKNVFLQLQLG